MRRLAGALIALALAAGCGRGDEGSRPPAPAATSPPAIPAPWSALGLPAKGLLRVRPGTDAHGFYADYSGQDRAALMAEVARGLWRAGYAQACSALQGSVVGFAKGDHRLAVAIDALGYLSLSVFDAQGKEPALYEHCFGRFTARPSP